MAEEIDGLVAIAKAVALTGLSDSTCGVMRTKER